MSRMPAHTVSVEIMLSRIASPAKTLSHLAQHSSKTLAKINDEMTRSLVEAVRDHPDHPALQTSMTDALPGLNAARLQAHQETFGNAHTFSGTLARCAHQLRDVLHRGDAQLSALLGAPLCEQLHAICNDAESLARSTHIVTLLQGVCALIDTHAATTLVRRCKRLLRQVRSKVSKRFGENLSRLPAVPRRVWDELEHGPASGKQLARRLHMSETHVCNAIRTIRRELGAGAITTSRMSGYSRADHVRPTL